MIVRLQRSIVATAAQPFAAKVAPPRTILRTVLTRRTATANRSYRDPKRAGTRPEIGRTATRNPRHRVWRAPPTLTAAALGPADQSPPDANRRSAIRDRLRRR